MLLNTILTRLLLLVVIGLASLLGKTQGIVGIDTSLAFPDKLYTSLDKKAASIDNRLDRQTAKYLSKLQNQENKLRKRLLKKDPALAGRLFEGVDEKYAELSKVSQQGGKYEAFYSGKLDSLTTSLNFLKEKNPAGYPGLQKTLERYKSLQSKLDQTEWIKKYLSERQKVLKEGLHNLGLEKELKAFQKQAYYYKAQVNEYKELLGNSSKLEARLLKEVQKLPQFKEFFASNSMLGSLFPTSSGDPSIALAGLQTRASVNQSLIDRFGSGAQVAQTLRQNMNAAQAELNQLKNKVNTFSSGGYGNSSDIEMPDGFIANTQKSRNFFKRLEYGANIQTGRGSSYFPLTSDLGLFLGYKLNDKSSVGVGASYKIGWGTSWSNIKISHQGVGLRSFLDYKIKGSLYISGGYEQNYRNEIHSIDQLKDHSAWQSSGLLGLSKRYKLGKKLKGELKLLWDFLSYQQVPRAQAVVFRVGYNF